MSRIMASKSGEEGRGKETYHVGGYKWFIGGRGIKKREEDER